MVLTAMTTAECMDDLGHLAALFRASSMVNKTLLGVSALEMGLEVAYTLLSDKGQSV